MEELLTALLAGVAGGKSYWVRAPQGVSPPYVTLQRVTGIRDYHMQGESGLVMSRVQADCYGATYTSAKQTARALIAAVSGHAGGAVQAILVDSERDLPAADAGETVHLFRTSVDLIVHTQET